jgi:molybdenum cofactor biosynthesis protein MoaC
MVNVGAKSATVRTATASIQVELNKQSFSAIRENQVAKGDVLTVAKLAAIQAAKKTSELIPLCHQIPLSFIDLSFELDEEQNRIIIKSVAKAEAATGVEMEAIVACSIAALTIYDMVKSVQKDIVIGDLKLLSKKGGKSGEFNRNNS